VRKVLRAAIVVTLSAAIQAAALTGPFVHAHPDDLVTAHHSGRSVHTHWSGHAQSRHPADASVFSTDDHDRAVFVDAFVATSGSRVTVPAVAQGTVDLLVPAARAAHRGVEVVRSHDPPFARLRSSRAPPAFLS
jgi:hypothetical protein